MSNMRKVLAVIIMLLGCGFLLFPSAQKYYHAYKAEQLIENIEKLNTSVQEVVDEYTEMDRLYDELLAYNQEIYENEQADLQDPFDYQEAMFDIMEYGMESNVIGSIYISRLEQNLPIYLGATYENMSKGAVILGQTSMPTGGNNTNVVIAAHRGWNGIPMFRDIQMIEYDDIIEITTPWDVLYYKVCEIKIIDPYDSDRIMIREGRDLVTLFTCHPYTQNYQRYMVVAERVKDVNGIDKETENDASTSKEIEMVDINGVSQVVKIDSTSIVPVDTEGIENGASYSNLQIWLENYGVMIAIPLLVMIVGYILFGNKKRRR